MFMYMAHAMADNGRATEGERGAGIVEWLGISALSVGMLVVVFSGLEQLGVDLVDSIRGQLGL